MHVIIMSLKISDVAFIELLEHHFKLAATTNLGDIYDGEVYKEHSSIFSSKHNLSFILNFDGARHQLCINELPPISGIARI